MKNEPLDDGEPQEPTRSTVVADHPVVTEPSDDAKEKEKARRLLQNKKQELPPPEEPEDSSSRSLRDEKLELSGRSLKYSSKLRQSPMPQQSPMRNDAVAQKVQLSSRSDAAREARKLGQGPHGSDSAVPVPPPFVQDDADDEEEVRPGSIAVRGYAARSDSEEEERAWQSQEFTPEVVDESSPPLTQSLSSAKNAEDGTTSTAAAETPVLVAELVEADPEKAQLQAQERARQEILSQAVAADIVEPEKPVFWRRRGVLCAAAVIVVVLIAVAVTLGVLLGQKSTATPSTVWDPWVTNNDACNMSRPVLNNGRMYAGSLANATASQAFYINPDTNDLVEIGPLSRWFLFEGDGTAVTMRYCIKPNSTLNDPIVVTGADCNNLVMDMNVRFFNTTPRADDGENICRNAVFRSVLGDTHRIVWTGPTAERSWYSLELYGSDNCHNAEPLDILGADKLVIGSTVNALPSIVPHCPASRPNNTHGLWYTVQGHGRALIFGTCRGTRINTQITVFTGSCDDLQCVEGNENACGEQSWVDWLGTDGETYYLFVSQGFGSTDFGPFSLYNAEQPRNDICEGSTAVGVGDVVRTNNVNATNDFSPVVFDNGLGNLDCGDTNEVANRGMGIWYHVQLATDQQVRSTAEYVHGNTCGVDMSHVVVPQITVDPTCDDPTLPLTLSIFEGPCSNLRCVDHSVRTACAPISWLARAGTVYHILFDTPLNQAGGFFAFNVSAT